MWSSDVIPIHVNDLYGGQCGVEVFRGGCVRGKLAGQIDGGLNNVFLTD